MTRVTAFFMVKMEEKINESILLQEFFEMNIDLKEFLEALGHREGSTEYRALDRDKKPKIHFAPAGIPVDLRAQSNYAGLYFGVCPRKNDKSGTKKDVLGLGAFWVDMDPRECEKEGILVNIKEILPDLLYPSIIVDSGNGYHLYWILEPFWNFNGDDDIQKAETILRSIAVELNGDTSSAEVARVLRVPGSVNLKVRENPKQVKIVHWNPDKKFDITAFDYFLQKSDEKKEEKKQTEKAYKKLLEKGVKIHERNNALISLAGKLINTLSLDQLETVIHSVNLCNCIPPLEEKEVNDVISSALKRYKKDEYDFELVPLSKFLDNVKDVEWIIPDWIFAGGLTLVAGRPKLGKSLIILQLALSLSNGVELFKNKLQPVNVAMILTEEGAPELKMRINKMSFDVNDNVFIHLGSIDLFKDTMISKLEELISKNKIRLLVFDPLIRLHDMDENDSRIAKVLYRIRDMARRLNIGVLIVHHTRKSSGTHGSSIRGSSSILAAADIAIVLEDEGDKISCDMISRVAKEQKNILSRDEETLLTHFEGPLLDIRKQENLEKIKDALSEKEKLTVDELESITGLSKRTINRRIKEFPELLQKESLKVKGRKRKTYVSLIK